MAGLAIAILFMLMVAAPCLVALRSTRDTGTVEEYFPEEYFETDEFEPQMVAVEPFLPELPILGTVSEHTPWIQESVQPLEQRSVSVSLREAALEAEMEALMAKDRADRAHWEALTAAARAASLRADAAAEAAHAAGMAAERAMMAAEAGFHFDTETQPQNPNPPLRISGSRRVAA